MYRLYLEDEHAVEGMNIPSLRDRGVRLDLLQPTEVEMIEGALDRITFANQESAGRSRNSVSRGDANR